MPDRIRPEWAKLRESGWVFVYDLKTRTFGAEHEDGGTLKIATFEQGGSDRLRVLCNQIGVVLATMLNEEEG